MVTATPRINPKHIERGQVLATPTPNWFLTPDGPRYIAPGQPGWSEYWPAQPPGEPRAKAGKRPKAGAGDRWTAWVQRVLRRIQLRRKRRWS